MMDSSSQEPALGRETVPRTNRTLKPYRGTLVPGIYFSSGYCLLAFDFPSVPREIDPYTYVWVITPDDDRTIYIEPEVAIETVEGYHDDFDRAIGADITWEEHSADSARVTVAGEDGTHLELELSLGQTTATRLLNAMVALTPKRVFRTQFGAALGSLLLDRLLSTNGTKVAGRSSNGSPYRLEADRISVITNAAATLDGTDLGTPDPPARLIEFGDVKVGNVPLYIRGDSYLPVPEHVTATAIQDEY